MRDHYSPWDLVLSVTESEQVRGGLSCCDWYIEDGSIGGCRVEVVVLVTTSARARVLGAMVLGLQCGSRGEEYSGWYLPVD